MKLILMILLVITSITLQAQKRYEYLRNQCAFGETTKESYGITYNQRLDGILRNIINSIGFSGDRIVINSTNDISYAVTGLRESDDAEILINDNFIGKSPSYFSLAVLVHELAHIFNLDIFNSRDSSKLNNELKADYYVGFWAAKNNVLIDSVKRPFLDIKEDSLYPKREHRLQSIDSGWIRGSKGAIELSDSFGLNYAQKYEKFANLYFIVSRTPKGKELNYYKVHFLISSKSKDVPILSIESKIDKVVYVLHDTFKRLAVTSRNENDDNYGYTLINVWGSFPVVALIYFNDGSILPLVKKFNLLNSEIKKK